MDQCECGFHHATPGWQECFHCGTVNSCPRCRKCSECGGTTPSNLFIAYRTGGTVNFEWRPVLEVYHSVEEARPKRDEIERMGYPTKLVISMDKMPTTFTGD